MMSLETILTNDDVVSSIKNKIDYLLNIIPEIRDMIGFDHKHPHHHLDVWEHTLFALSHSVNNFEIRLVLLLHDIGKPHSYQEENNIRHFKGHAEVSKNIAYTILSRLGYPEDFIIEVCSLISKHDTPMTKEDISTNPIFYQKLYEVQRCDALAHHPAKLEKRLAYLTNVENYFKTIQVSQKLTKNNKKGV